jgi:hypothetical protein
LKPESRKDAGKFKPGVSGNPGGKKPLDPEIKEMRDAVLSRAVKILYAKIHDEKYIGKLRPAELEGFLSMAFDRCGLPKVTKSELTGEGGGPLTVTVVNYGGSVA